MACSNRCGLQHAQTPGRGECEVGNYMWFGRLPPDRAYQPLSVGPRNKKSFWIQGLQERAQRRFKMGSVLQNKSGGELSHVFQSVPRSGGVGERACSRLNRWTLSHSQNFVTNTSTFGMKMVKSVKFDRNGQIGLRRLADTADSSFQASLWIHRGVHITVQIKSALLMARALGRRVQHFSSGQEGHSVERGYGGGVPGRG